MNPIWTDKPRVPLWVDGDDPIVSQHLIQHGDWDAPLADFLEINLTPGDTFLDLGAHCGYFTAVAAPRCRRVIAVEPQADMAELLRRNAPGNVSVRQVAVGVPGERDLYVPLNRGAASFNHEVGTPEQVQVCELADVMDGTTIAKIDIEGDEPDVLCGDLPFNMLIFEFHPQKRGAECFGLVRAAGYTVYTFSGEKYDLPPQLPEGCYINLAGVRNGRA